RYPSRPAAGKRTVSLAKFMDCFSGRLEITGEKIPLAAAGSGAAGERRSGKMKWLRVSLWLLLVLLPSAAAAGDVNDELIAAARKNDLAAVKGLLGKGGGANGKK